MNKGLFISVSAVAMMGVVVSSPAFCEVVARYDGLPGYGPSDALAIATAPSGNVYVTGYSGNGSDDTVYATVAYDANLNQLWVRRFDGSAANDIPRAIATDSFGNVYVTGATGEVPRVGGLNIDYATVAYDSSGNRLWIKRYDSPGNGDDEATAIATDASGNVYVTGSSAGDYATIAYNSSGIRLWARRYGPGGATAIATDASGNVYVTGNSPGQGGNVYATIAYDSSGTQLWVRRYHGPANGDDVAKAIATDAAGNIYVTGTSDAGVGKGRLDYATLAYNASGTLLWVRRYNASTNDQATAITTDTSGHIYVTGSSNSSTGTDYATLAYNSKGTLLWVRRYNGSIKNDDYNTAAAIVTDASGNVYVAGYSDTSTGRADYATIAYRSNGTQLWVQRYTNPGSNSEASAIATDASGNVYVTGVSDGGYTTVKYSAGQ